jgi:TolB protein
MYVSEAGGLPQVWLADADGTDAHRFGDLPGATFPADADPRGTHALIVQAEDGPNGAHRETLWLAPLDGTAPAKLAAAGALRNPAWTPDGAYVVFESDQASFRDLFVVAREGGDVQRVTDAPNGTFEPALGGGLAFGSSRDGNAEVYVMSGPVAAAGAPVRITDDPADDVHPRWSPDGKVLTWISSRGGTPRVWRSAPDGAGARPVRPRTGVDLDQAWSPKGDRLAVVVQTGPSEVRIEVVDPEKGDVLATIDGKGVDEQPAWSPDGEWLAFTSGRAGSPDVWVARADGTGARAVTSGPAPEWLPRWVR